MKTSMLMTVGVFIAGMSLGFSLGSGIYPSQESVESLQKCVSHLEYVTDLHHECMKTLEDCADLLGMKEKR